ncbi:MAG: hypothetical protein ACRDTA_14725, partial [Pseudonocardiaceae bacterium]
FHQALSARREAGDRQGEAVTLKALGTTLHDAGHPDRARDSWRSALAILTELNDPLAAAIRASLEGPENP